MKTFDKNLVERIYNLWEKTLGMEKVTFTTNAECLIVIDCYKYRDFFVRLDTFYSGDELLYCIETAEDEHQARYNVFEDSWLYPETLGADKIVEQMQLDLLDA